MKVLLINPPVGNAINSELPLIVKQNEGIFPPLGLMYIAAYLTKYLDCQVKILDTIAERMDCVRIEEYLRDFHPAITGIIAHTHNLMDVVLITQVIKNIDRNIHVCLGGPHVNIFPQESISLAGVDSIVLGEGEITFAELVRRFKEKDNLTKVKGIILKQNGQFINTGLRENIKNLDSLPFPARGLLDHRKYYNILDKRAIMATMISTRGCPYQCSFCSTPKGEYRMRSPGNVVQEMEECARGGIEEIHFVDDTFNVNSGRVLQLCEEIKQRKLRIGWSFRGRIDKLDEFVLKKLKEAGCYRIHLGVETSTDEGLEYLKKGITLREIKQVFRWAREVSINTVAYFLIGCPYERSKEDVIRTINFAKQIDPDFALFNILMPYPSTQVYEDGLRTGVLNYDYWKEFASNPRRDFQPQFWDEWLSRNDLLYLLNLAYRNFYLRPKFLFRMLTVPQNLTILTKRLKTGLRILRLPLCYGK